MILSLTIAILPASAHAQAPASSKQVVRTQDYLPRYTYAIFGIASALLAVDDATFNAFAAKVAADIGTTLRSYNIVDRSSKRSLLMTLESIAVLHRDDPRVLALAEQIHEVGGKPADKLLSSMRLEALIAAHGQTGRVAGDRFRSAYASNYAASLNVLPWSVVGEAIKDRKSAAILQTAPVIMGSVSTFIEPAVARSAKLSGDLAAQLIYARVVAKVWLPISTQTIAVLKAYIAAHRVEKPDIWTAREATLTNSQKLTIVTVAISDEGSDLSVFPGQVFDDPHPDPRSNAQGLAFDIDFNPTHGELIPLAQEQNLAYPIRLHDIQGVSDSEQGIDSPAADALLDKIASLRAGEVPKIIEELNFLGSYYPHGTHVAEIAARGNPAIRLQ